MKAKNEPLDTLALLQDALEFDDVDLAANREGYMTDNQRKHLQGKQQMKIFGWLGIAGLVGCLTFCPAFFGAGAFDVLFSTSFGLFLFIVFVSVGVWMFVLATRVYQRLNADLRKRDISAVSGIVRLDIVQNGRAMAFKIYVRGESFSVSRAVLLAFQNQMPYTIYYAPNTRAILAAEPLLTS